MADFRCWPSSSVFALVCCRKGDPLFKSSEGVIVDKCYCCSHEIMVSVHNQKNKMSLKSEAEFLCLDCLSKVYRRPVDQQVLTQEQFESSFHG